MKAAKLGDICEIKSGGTPSRTQDRYYGGSIPWAKISDIERSNGTIFQTEETLTEDGLNAIRGRLFPKGTLLFAIYGSVGKMAFAGREISSNQAILGIQIKNRNILNDKYLYRFLEFRRDSFEHDAMGITQKNLSATYVRDIEIPNVLLSEQKRIAAILDQADDLRRARRRSVERLNDLSQAIFYEMFGDPIINPKQWPEDKKLGDVAEIVSGITKGRKLKGQKTREVPYLAVINVQDRFTGATLGAVCGELHTWPHATIKEAAKKMYGFRSGYPGIGHGATAAGVLREIEMRDLVAVSILLAGFAPYLTDQINSDIVYRGS